MVAALCAEHAGHADVVRVIVVEKVLGARGSVDWRLQPLGECHHLIVRMGTA
jgi:hypothetical protein